ncbi:unnamed protein product [Bursaphelenchus xylophilus]|uniref:(pine wood nematode) hypothetical protein n=1 Tax=Bursaphelenchus xylophilus TaxID=6326 RepID=A0A1I7SSG3_BURXY|nr:unnamed protein product [Bursaphelenchus xylophilus]CAG9097580.1 unnamed protein product [Bursaphelenchus xylophilus]
MFWRREISEHDRRIEEAVKRLEVTRIEREIALREAINERKNAYKIAEAQERFKWLSLTGVSMSLMSVVAAVNHKNLFYSIPVIPCTVIIGYEAHKAYGNKLETIIESTEEVMKKATRSLSSSFISVKEIDSRVEDLLTSPEVLD